jgi:hypothetical protein
MAISRSTLVQGPARCLLNARPFFTNDSFAITPELDIMRVVPEGFTQGDERVTDVQVKIQLTPDGRVNNNLLAELFPYQNPVPGASACGASDKPFAAHGADTAISTVIAVCVSQMPEIVFSSKQTMMGQLGLTGVLGNNMDPDDADSRLTYAASGGTFVDSTFNLANIPTQQYLATWGAVTGFSNIHTREGYRFRAEVDLEPSPVDGLGIIDYKIKEVRAMLSCIPVGPTAAQLLTNLKIQGTGARLGRSLNADAAALTLVGADGITYLTMPKASLKQAGFVFGKERLRNDEIAWVATLNHTTGTQGNLFTLNSEA